MRDREEMEELGFLERGMFIYVTPREFNGYGLPKIIQCSGMIRPIYIVSSSVPALWVGMPAQTQLYATNTIAVHWPGPFGNVYTGPNGRIT